MNIKRILTPLLIILLLFSIVVMGAPTYVNIGPTSYIEGDVGVPADKGYYIGDVLFSTTGLIDIGALAKTDGNFIVGDGNNWIAETGATARASLGIDLALYYLKTEVDTQGEMETIWGVSLENETHASEHVVSGADTIFPADPDADRYLMWDDAPTGELVWDEGGGGYTNLTSFVDQTAWRLFYSNNLGDVTELALGTDGQYLKSTGATSAPIFDTPAGAGDMLKATYDVDVDGDIDVAAGGTEKSAWTLYAIPYLSGTTTFGEIPIGTAEYALTVNAGANGYDWTLFDLTLYYLKTEIDTQGEMETIWGDTLMNDLVDDTGPNLGGELDAGAHSIGFTQQSTTGDGTTTIDWKLGNKFKFTFGAQNDTFTFTAPTNPCNILLMLIQDGTGSRIATWPGTVKWAGGTAPTLTTTAAGIDICSFYWDGTNYFGVASLAFATP